MESKEKNVNVESSTITTTTTAVEDDCGDDHASQPSSSTIITPSTTSSSNNNNPNNSSSTAIDTTTTVKKMQHNRKYDIKKLTFIERYFLRFVLSETEIIGRLLNRELKKNKNKYAGDNDGKMIFFFLIYVFKY